MIVLAQYSTLCLLLNCFSIALATKQNFLCTFIMYKSGITWIFEKRPDKSFLPASWPYRGLTLALGLLGTSVNESQQQMDVFFWESNRPGARSLLLRKGSYLPVAYMLPVHQTYLLNNLLFTCTSAPRFQFLDVLWLRNSRRMDALGYLLTGKNVNKNLDRPTQLVWDLHGPNVPWNLPEILLLAGWFLATSIP